MIADLFRKDYRQLTAQGVKFTPEDIVRLNALAVRAQLSATAAHEVHLPRCAFLPGRLKSGMVERLKGLWNFLTFQPFNSSTLVLREPTVAHDLWIEQAMRYVPMDSRNMNFLYGYALSREPEELVSTFRPAKLIRTVFRFAAKRLAFYTEDQLSAAVDYCLFGADWTAGERGPMKNEELGMRNDGDSAIPHSSFNTPNSPTIGLLTKARALRLPITLDDAKRMTASELAEAIDRAMSDDGKIDWEKTRIAALKPYVLARNEIRRRSATAPTAASTESRQPTPSSESSSRGEAQ